MSARSVLIAYRDPMEGIFATFDSSLVPMERGGGGSFYHVFLWVLEFVEVYAVYAKYLKKQNKKTASL